MRKPIALLLALCMLAAAASALGEDFSGTWYWIMADVTMGTMELNGDGTAFLDITISGKRISGGGAWEETEDGVNVVFDRDPMPMVYDAETGILSCSLIPVRVSREAARFDADTIIAAIRNGYTGLPEGVTEEEARKAALDYITELMLFRSVLTGEIPSGGETAAPENGD